MIKLKRVQIIVFLFIVSLVSAGCSNLGLIRPTASPAFIHSYKYVQIEGFSEETNDRFRKFFQDTLDYKDRKVAVFDCDGTILGQVPHYLADESIYTYANENKNLKPQLVKNMTTRSNVGEQYVVDRIKYLAGMNASTVQNLGADCFENNYEGKFYPEILKLIGNLKNFGFEVWIVSASPEVLYEKFVSERTGVPVTRIIGVKSVIKNGVITDEMVHPVPQDNGKEFTIDTFIKTKPLFAAGNSRGDFEMLSASRMLKLIVNPDDTKKEKIFNGMTLKEYAKNYNWVIVNCNDVPEPGFPSVSSKVFNIKKNTSHPKE